LWVAGSTHAGEERLLLEAHRLLREAVPDALLVLAPRHPQRFEEAAETIAQAGWTARRRSQQRAGGSAPVAPGSPGEVLLLDTLGELMEAYAAADVAFVGGSLVPVGGHNLLEPAALALPVLSGPHQFNSPDVARVLAEQRALTLVSDPHELAEQLTLLLRDPVARARQGEQGRRVIDANRGALARLLALLEEVLEQHPGTAPRPLRPRALQ
jgi:3-deoxy-D-manno-octulosonic-acid transferase